MANWLVHKCRMFFHNITDASMKMAQILSFDNLPKCMFGFCLIILVFSKWWRKFHWLVFFDFEPKIQLAALRGVFILKFFPSCHQPHTHSLTHSLSQKHTLWWKTFKISSFSPYSTRQRTECERNIKVVNEFSTKN